MSPNTFIYITAYSDKSTVERATVTFTCGYILKPISQQNLYVAIQTALNIIRNKQAELVLSKAYEELKIKVKNYTTKLALVNDELKLEITRPHQLESELSTKKDVSLPTTSLALY